MGVTHHATEDLAVMRALPGLVVVAPGDPIETRLATRALVAHAGPCYLRLGKAGEPQVHRGEIDFELGKAVQLGEGHDLTLISTGGMLRITVDAAERLRSTGVQTRVLSMHTLKPLDQAAILDAACETGAIMTIEEHSVIGGLGSAVAEVLAEADQKAKVPFKRIGLPSFFSPYIGSQEYLQTQHGLSQEGIFKSAVELLTKKRKSVVDGDP
jgi:transketolase